MSVQSSRKDVEAFLNELRGILDNAAFHIDTDLFIIKSKKFQDKEQFSTPYTLLDLDYNADDIAARLRELTIQDYSESLVDRDDCNPPILFVFGKDINGRLIYIKLKIKGNQKRHILCVSFHYAEREMHFPFR